MRKFFTKASCAVLAGVCVHLAPAPPAFAQACAAVHIAAESVSGTIIAIAPAPDPFMTADIVLAGSPPCDRLWLQVLKTDAGRCRVGWSVRARGVITSDSENGSWEINPLRNTYMMLGDDFTCGP